MAKNARILQERSFSRNFCEKMVQASVTLTLRIDLSCRSGGFSLLKTCRRLQTPNRSSWCPNAKNIYSSAAIFRELFTTSLLRKVLVFRKLVSHHHSRRMEVAWSPTSKKILRENVSSELKPKMLLSRKAAIK